MTYLFDEIEPQVAHPLENKIDWSKFKGVKAAVCKVISSILF